MANALEEMIANGVVDGLRKSQRMALQVAFIQ